MNDDERESPPAAQAAPAQPERTARAVAAAVAVARAHGLRVDEPAVLAQGYAVRVHLRPAPVVARVSTITAILRAPIAPWLARELEVAAFLAARGASVVPPSDLLPPGPHQHDGLGVSFWQYIAPASGEGAGAASGDVPGDVAGDVPGAAQAGRMLAELHAALRDYPGALPLLAPPLGDIPRGLARIEQAGNILPAHDIALLRGVWEDLQPGLSPEALGPLQPLHGDAHVHNLIRSADGWLWNDFEDVCLGPVGWDLASLDSDGQALAAYADAPDAASLALFRRVRQLHGIVWVYALSPEWPDWLGPVGNMLAHLRSQEQGD